MLLCECRFIFNKKGAQRMMDTVEFEIALKRVGLTKKKVAQSLGISDMSLYQKVNNITEFKASEISKLYELLKLSSLTDQQKIFFAH